MKAGVFEGQSPLSLRILLMILSGVGLCVAASAGLAVFVSQATWFTDPGPFAADWNGYDRGSFTGLTFFTFLASPGAALLYTGIVGLIDNIRATSNLTPRSLTVLLIIPAVLFLIVAFVSIGWAEEVFKCGWIFCLTTTVEPEVRNERPEAGIGFLAVTSTSIFFAALPIALAIVAAIGSEFISGMRTATFNITGARPFWTRVIIAIVCGFLLQLMTLFYFFVVSVLPNNWEYMSAPRVAAFIAKGVSPRDECPWGACPELPDAYFVSSELVLKKGVVTMKLFPSSLFFYGYLLFAASVMPVLVSVPLTRNFLKKRVRLYWITMSCQCYKAYVFTIGEIMGSIGTVGMITLFFMYWAQSHNYNGYWNPTMGEDTIGVTPSERWGRTFGQLAVVFLSLLLIPASRHSFLHSMLGTSWEAFLWAHRVLGYGMLLAVLGHMIAWYVKYNEVGLFPQEILNVPASIPTCIDNFTVPLITLTTFFLLIAMGVLTLPVIRRRFFELFYYSHIIAAYSTIPAVLWHAQAGWEYMLPGLTFWFFDRVSRVYRSAIPATAHSLRTFDGPTPTSQIGVGEDASLMPNGSPQLVEIFFKSTSLKTASPGQYVFINVPEVSLLEWHPFTISSFNAEEGTYSIHIKCMGPNTWTARVIQHAKRTLIAAGVQGEGVFASAPEHAQAIQRGFIIKVDGPYGHATPINDFEQIILVGGGIGITPCSAILQSIQRQRRQVDHSGSPGDTIVSTAREADLQEPSLGGGGTAPIYSGVGVRKVSLLWSLRDAYLVESLSDVLSGFAASSRLSNFDSKGSSLQHQLGTATPHTPDELNTIYCTQKDCIKLDLPDGFKMECCRPDYKVEFERLVQSVPASKTLVFACGPDTLVQSALLAAMDLGCHFHNETFEL